MNEKVYSQYFIETNQMQTFNKNNAPTKVCYDGFDQGTTPQGPPFAHVDYEIKFVV